MLKDNHNVGNLALVYSSKASKVHFLMRSKLQDSGVESSKFIGKSVCFQGRLYALFVGS